MSHSNIPTNVNLVPATVTRRVRRYVIPAIYIEKEITEVLPRRIISPISECTEIQDNFLSRKDSNTSIKKIIKVLPQRIISPISECDEILDNYVSSNGSNTTIASNSNVSPSSEYFSTQQSSSRSSDLESTTSTLKLEAQANSIVKFEDDELKLDLGSLAANRTSTPETSNIIRTREDIDSRQKLIKEDRENFKNSLAKIKNKEQEMKRMKNKLKIEEERLEKEKNERKKIENINRWLKKKKFKELGKKFAQHLVVLESYLAKSRRMEESEQAYKEWLENAKHRPKPNQSLTFFNPISWKPNTKPTINK